jgi:ArsR family transcriptional regulator, lead/cadmium/zinc/bismuth-responsive transcriptional repressor
VLHGWAGLFAALGDPGRLLLLITIQEAESISVSDLANVTGRSGTTVSHSLPVLRQRGLVTANRQGRTVRYMIANAALGELLRGLGLPRQHPPGGPLRPEQGRHPGAQAPVGEPGDDVQAGAQGADQGHDPRQPKGRTRRNCIGDYIPTSWMPA